MNSSQISSMVYAAAFGATIGANYDFWPGFLAIVAVVVVAFVLGILFGKGR